MKLRNFLESALEKIVGEHEEELRKGREALKLVGNIDLFIGIIS